MDDIRGLKRKVLEDLLDIPDDDPPGRAATANASSDNSPTETKRPRTEPDPKRTVFVENLTSMPLELLEHIACNLFPSDLLALRKASKIVKLHMEDFSRRPWIEAERACGLPECPTDISHLQYAAWIFGKSCMVCSRYLPTRHFFIARVRLCKNCFSERIKFGKDIIFPSAVPRGETNDVYSLAPWVSLAGRLRVVKWTSDFGYPSKSDPFGFSVYYAPALNKVHSQYLAVPTKSGRREFVAQKYKAAMDVQKFAIALDKWYAEWAKEPEESLQRNDLRLLECRDESFNRLRELGYSFEDLDSRYDGPGWKWNEVIEKPQILMNSYWNARLPRLRDTIFLRRINSPKSSAEEKHADLFRIMKEILRANCFVTLRTVLQIPIVQDAVTYNPETRFSNTNLQTLKKEIARTNNSFLAQLQERCSSLLLDCRGCKPASTKPSDIRAVCHRPAAFFVYRQRYEHYHFQLKTFREIARDTREECRGALRENGNVDWTFEDRIFAPPAFLINALYDALQITASRHEGMAAKGKRFKCLRCKPPRSEVMTWVELVRHFYEENKFFFRKNGEKWSPVIASDITNDHGTDVTVHGPLVCDITQMPDAQAASGTDAVGNHGFSTNMFSMTVFA